VVSADHISNISNTYGPSVDGEVAVAVGLVGTSVADGSGRTSCPTLATDEIALVVAPSDTELAAIAVGVGSVACAAMREQYVSA
jgi:hypothetical protein